MNFKKIVSAVMCMGIMSSGIVLNTANAAVNLGDINGDNKIDSKDAVLVLKDYAENLAGKSTAIDKTVADVNADNSVDSKDAVWILRYYANTLTGYEKDISEFIKNPILPNGHYFGEISLTEPKDFFTEDWCTIRADEKYGGTAHYFGIGLDNSDEEEIKEKLGKALKIVLSEYGYYPDCYVFIGG